ncbi:MAG: hypothetical protein JOZ96_08825 [Acidobacteria bacterium]|nr:hypothetical protein [Acidobacteriota bacterium]
MGGGSGTGGDVGGGSGNGGGNRGGEGGRHHGGGRGDGDNHRDHGRRHDKDDRDHHRDRHRHSRYDDTIYQPTDNNAGYQVGDGRDECQRGYDQGYATGLSDARRGQSKDPYRSRHYKNGGGGFWTLGRSAADKQAYRDCFLRGYEEGFGAP